MPIDKVIRAGVCKNGEPHQAISFFSKKKRIDHELFQIAKMIFHGYADQYMYKGPAYFTSDLGLGAHRMVGTRLLECSCAILCRIHHPQIRRQFEDIALHHARNIVDSQIGPFQLNIAIAFPGQLLGEFIFMVRLLGMLGRRTGTIRLHLIDREYKGIMDRVDKTSKDIFFPSAKSDQELAVEEFTEKLTALAASEISLTVDVFKELHDYQVFCGKSASFKSHLLIGEDVAKGRDLILETGRQTQLQHGVTVILDKVNKKARLTQATGSIIDASLLG